MEIAKLDHLENLIGSLNKMLLDAKNKGIIRNKELSLLNLIFKLVNNNCYYDLKYSNKKKLIDLYYKLLSKYSFLCKGNISSSNNIYIYNNIEKTFIDTNDNTAPEIGDPEPSNPQTSYPPILCEDTKQVSLSNSSKHYFIESELNSCFIDPNDYEEGIVQYMKIVSLPLYNPLTYQGVNVTIGQVIDLSLLNSSINSLIYLANLNQSDLEDNFTYQVSTSSYPNIYNTQVITMNITVGNP